MKALRVGLYAALVVGWIALAWVLWGSVVPEGLALPHVDVDAAFGQAVVDEARRFERLLLVLWVLGIVVTLVTLALYARHGGRFVEEGRNRLLRRAVETFAARALPSRVSHTPVATGIASMRTSVVHAAA